MHRIDNLVLLLISIQCILLSFDYHISNNHDIICDVFVFSIWRTVIIISVLYQQIFPPHCIQNIEISERNQTSRLLLFQSYKMHNLLFVLMKVLNIFFKLISIWILGCFSKQTTTSALHLLDCKAHIDKQNSHHCDVTGWSHTYLVIWWRFHSQSAMTSVHCIMRTTNSFELPICNISLARYLSDIETLATT